MSEFEYQKWLITQVAKLAEISPSEIDIQEPFSVYGLTSASAISITGDIEDAFQLKISPTVVWDYPTIASMSSFLATQGSKR